MSEANCAHLTQSQWRLCCSVKPASQSSRVSNCPATHTHSSKHPESSPACTHMAQQRWTPNGTHQPTDLKNHPQPLTAGRQASGGPTDRQTAADAPQHAHQPDEPAERQLVVSLTAGVHPSKGNGESA
ncbi:HhH-GPD base excision DNA repair family protein [Striga asiatica]|uniref:HhH-GPD base excision DNA repair family protein n=1 Tax=Striga asiatica TaxID=4170 RepID=A0A5A7NW80_STRAF|nr:HhH-GPD base excision DNA repair family protein [Striga asiatica]